MKPQSVQCQVTTTRDFIYILIESHSKTLSSFSPRLAVVIYRIRTDFNYRL